MDENRALNVTPTTHSDNLLVGDLKVHAFLEAGFFVRLTRLLSSPLTPDHKFHDLQRLLLEAVPLDRMAVVMFNSTDRHTVYAFSKTDTTSSALDDFDCHIARTVQESQKEMFSPPFPAPLSLETLGIDAPPPVHDVLAASLWQQGTITGALVVASHRAEIKFLRQHEDIVLIVAQQLSLMFEREQAIQEARKRTDQMAAFSAVASTVNEWVSVDQLARRFLGIFLNTTGTDHGLFYLLNGDEELTLVGHFGIPPGSIEAFRMEQSAIYAELRGVIDSGQLAVRQALTRTDASDHAHALTGMLHVDSLLFLPLRVKGQVVGMVALGKTQGDIDLPDHEFIQGIADQAAQAIENARLFTEAERRVEEQSALRELAQRFLSAVSPDQVLEQTLDTLADLIPGEYYEVLLPDNQGGFTLVNGRGWRRGIIGRSTRA